MDGNPFSALLELLRTEQEQMEQMAESKRAGLGAQQARLRLGRVVQREPLEIVVAGIKQPTTALKINERLTKGAKRKTKITSQKTDARELTGTLKRSDGSTTGITDGKIHSEDLTIDESEETQLEIDLEVDDDVLLLTEDDQIFFILMRVVDAV